MKRQSAVMRLLFACLTFASFAAAGSVRAGVSLVMVQQAGGVWCARWDRDVSTEYPKTSEGRAAPLPRVDLRPLPENLKFISQPRVTPTFVLMRDGREVGPAGGLSGRGLLLGPARPYADRGRCRTGERRVVDFAVGACSGAQESEPPQGGRPEGAG